MGFFVLPLLYTCSSDRWLFICTFGFSWEIRCRRARGRRRSRFFFCTLGRRFPGVIGCRNAHARASTWLFIRALRRQFPWVIKCRSAHRRRRSRHPAVSLLYLDCNCFQHCTALHWLALLYTHVVSSGCLCSGYSPSYKEI